jgi:hypothetical protein
MHLISTPLLPSFLLLFSSYSRHVEGKAYLTPNNKVIREQTKQNCHFRCKSTILINSNVCLEVCWALLLFDGKGHQMFCQHLNCCVQTVNDSESQIKMKDIVCKIHSYVWIRTTVVTKAKFCSSWVTIPALKGTPNFSRSQRGSEKRGCAKVENREEEERETCFSLLDSRDLRSLILFESIQALSKKLSVNNHFSLFKNQNHQVITALITSRRYSKLVLND